MKLEDISKKLLKEGIAVIHVEEIPEDDECLDLRIIGGLDAFVEAAKALKIGAAFVSAITFEEENFYYKTELDEEDEDFDDSPESSRMYLPSENPEMDGFKKFIGQHGIIKLSIQLQRQYLSCFLTEPWLDEFAELFNQAVKRIGEKQDAARLSVRMKVDGRQRQALTELGQLISDKVFIRLPTQKAMKAYALEKLPILECLSKQELAVEIQELNAQIISKGIKRK